MFFGKKSQPLLGLDITTSSVKLIEISKSGKRYRVESYSAEPTPPSSVNEKAIVDAKAVGEAIRRAVKRSGAKATDVAMWLSFAESWQSTALDWDIGIVTAKNGNPVAGIRE